MALDPILTKVARGRRTDRGDVDRLKNMMQAQAERIDELENMVSAQNARIERLDAPHDRLDALARRIQALEGKKAK